MKLTPLLIAALLSQMAVSARAATVESTATYELLNFSTWPGITAEWQDPDAFEDTQTDGTGTAETSAERANVGATAETSGRSSVAMDYATAQVISRDRLLLVNSGDYLAVFGGRILPHLSVEISGNNDGQSLPEGLFGELGSAVAALNVILTIFRTDGTEVQSTYFNGALELGFGETGTLQGTGGGINGLAFVGSLNPGERAELVFESSAISNAWHANALGEDLPPVPVPGGLALLPGGLATFFGLRRRRKA